jgi:hypothetical protein
VQKSKSSIADSTIIALGCVTAQEELLRLQEDCMVKRHSAGNTIPMAAQKLGMGAGQLRRAIASGEVNYVEFAGLKRISDTEIERIAALLGLSVSEPVEPAAKPEKSVPKAKSAPKVKPARRATRRLAEEIGA